MNISVINYDNVNANFAKDLLEDLGYEVKLISDEINICTSEIIILPDCSDLLKANRKLQLFNLSNVLKIINRKIIGLNNGMFLMCSNILNSNINGLGFFSSNVFKFDKKQNCNIDYNKLTVLKQDCLNINFDNVNYNYLSDFYVLANQDTCIATQIDNKLISLVDKLNNYIGLNLSINTKGCEIRNLLNLVINL